MKYFFLLCSFLSFNVSAGAVKMTGDLNMDNNYDKEKYCQRLLKKKEFSGKLVKAESIIWKDFNCDEKTKIK